MGISWLGQAWERLVWGIQVAIEYNHGRKNDEGGVEIGGTNVGEVVSTGWIELAAQSMQGEDSGKDRLRIPGRGPTESQGARPEQRAGCSQTDAFGLGCLKLLAGLQSPQGLTY